MIKSHLINERANLHWWFIKICFCRFIIYVSTLTTFSPVGIAELNSATSSSTISNQLVAGSIIVTHIKSISVLFLPLRVYGSIRSTKRVSQGFEITSFVGCFPYLCWRLCQLVMYALFEICVDRIASLSNTLQHKESLQDMLFLDVVRGGDNILLPLQTKNTGNLPVHSSVPGGYRSPHR